MVVELINLDVQGVRILDLDLNVKSDEKKNFDQIFEKVEYDTSKNPQKFTDFDGTNQISKFRL